MSARARWRPWFRPEPLLRYWLELGGTFGLYAFREFLSCPYDPSELRGAPRGMFCPICGEVVLGGLPHTTPRSNLQR